MNVLSLHLLKHFVISSSSVCSFLCVGLAHILLILPLHVLYFFVALIISVTSSKFYFPTMYYYSDPPSLLSIGKLISPKYEYQKRDYSYQKKKTSSKVSRIMFLYISEVAQSCPTLCDPMDCVAYQAPLSMGFSRQYYWSGLPFPSPVDLPHPGMEPRSPALQTDTLLSEPPGKSGLPPYIRRQYLGHIYTKHGNYKDTINYIVLQY